MSKRFYLCPIIGDGTENNPYRPKIANNIGVNWSAPMPSNPDGTPKFPWTIVIVGAADHTSIVDDSTIDAFPELTYESTLGSLTQQERTKLLQFLDHKNIPTSGVNVNTTFREIIELVGQYLEPSFRSQKFDCQDR